MKVWCFASTGTLRALTADPRGETLPQDLGPWSLLSSSELGGVDADEQEARSLIERHGYCCFDTEPS